MKSTVVQIRTPLEKLTQNITSTSSSSRCERVDQVKIVQFKLMNRLKILSFEFQGMDSKFQGRSLKICSHYQWTGVTSRDQVIVTRLCCLYAKNTSGDFCVRCMLSSEPLLRWVFNVNDNSTVGINWLRWIGLAHWICRRCGCLAKSVVWNSAHAPRGIFWYQAIFRYEKGPSKRLTTGYRNKTPRKLSCLQRSTALRIGSQTHMLDSFNNKP
jgi:hypothetical protein